MARGTASRRSFRRSGTSFGRHRPRTCSCRVTPSLDAHPLGSRVRRRRSRPVRAATSPNRSASPSLFDSSCLPPEDQVKYGEYFPMSHVHRLSLPRTIGTIVVGAAVCATALSVTDAGRYRLAPGPPPPSTSPGPRNEPPPPRRSSSRSAETRTCPARTRRRRRRSSRSTPRPSSRSGWSRSRARCDVGGQRTIDSRPAVAHTPAGATRSPVPDDHGASYWLAAHNYGTHGPFHRLLRIKKGAHVTVKDPRRQALGLQGPQRRQLVDRVIRRGVMWGKWVSDLRAAAGRLETCKGEPRAARVRDAREQARVSARSAATVSSGRTSGGTPAGWCRRRG